MRWNWARLKLCLCVTTIMFFLIEIIHSIFHQNSLEFNFIFNCLSIFFSFCSPFPQHSRIVHQFLCDYRFKIDTFVFPLCLQNEIGSVLCTEYKIGCQKYFKNLRIWMFMMCVSYTIYAIKSKNMNELSKQNADNNNVWTNEKLVSYLSHNLFIYLLLYLINFGLIEWIWLETTVCGKGTIYVNNFNMI